MERKILVGRGALAVLGGLLVFVISLGALAGCGGSGNEGSSSVPSNTPNTTAQPPAGGATSAGGTSSTGGATVAGGAAAGGATTAGGTSSAGGATSGSDVAVRVSGAQNTAYSGTYGTAQNVQVADGIVGTEPTDYQVTGASDVVTATFKKTQPGADLLEVSILEGGEVVTGSQTYAEFGSVTVNWSPREETQGGGTTLPGGAGSDRSQP